ncbi:hypothetical protein CK203_061089 [Vitis vinifera]|uniref:Uncharacterized protein n=1 Tax=Vitis vinifera TaxID=29760 RepID=A0A438GA08_VITVI|nr:hypothetical protein CK203_061089 [Vitis vinifera]
MSSSRPSPHCTLRQRASAAQVPSDSPSQATEAPRIPPSEGGILRFLLTCHRSLLSDVRYSQHRPLRSAQIEERDLSTRSYFDQETMRQHLSSETLIAYCRGCPESTAIHFTIDGRHGILRPDILLGSTDSFELVDPSIFRQWSPISQKDMVRILSRGTSTDSILLRKELPPGMLLVDVVMCSNLFPLHHSILEHMGFPIEPRLDGRRLCQERFTLNKWNQLVGYYVPPGAPLMVASPILS